ncbi:hypothetical protein PRVXH_000474 [Proteinivorax hydrogeniformans]|uniref:Transposase n=1 Tax=Proteinivorax hydrogeniformans TaxID=1826727 RepID=A0AAU8HUR4_9FIRM
MINKVERLESERYYIDNFKDLNLNKTLKQVVLSDKFLCIFARLLPWELVLKYQVPSVSTVSYCIKAMKSRFPDKETAISCINSNKSLLTSQKKGLIQLIEREHCY